MSSKSNFRSFDFEQSINHLEFSNSQYFAVMAARTDVTFRQVRSTEVSAVYAIEIAGFPIDEAASIDSLTQRLTLAPQLFLGAYCTSSPSSETDPTSTTTTEELIGYICSTLTPSSTLTHDSMSTHIPSSAYVAIHSVCVAGHYRKQGIALQLLKNYLIHIKSLDGADIKGARLITHEEVIPLYEKAGFNLVGDSKVVHGSKKWLEMAFDFPIIRSPGVPFSSLGGMDGLLDQEGMNASDLYCPRGECKCLLLRKGVGKYVLDTKADDFKVWTLLKDQFCIMIADRVQPHSATATAASYCHIANSRSIKRSKRVLVYPIPTFIREYRILSECSSTIICCIQLNHINDQSGDD
jgi:ribosomal protein S18 acetylase RimI-like enzyme